MPACLSASMFVCLSVSKSACLCKYVCTCVCPHVCLSSCARESCLSCLSAHSVFVSDSHSLGESKHKAKDITQAIVWRIERGVERGLSARRSSLKGREKAIVNQTNIGTVSWATLGKLLRDGVERITMGLSECIDTILN